MLNVFWLGAALTVGQGSPTAPMPPTPLPISDFAAERPVKLLAPVKQAQAPAPTLVAPTLPKPGTLPFVQSSTPPARINVAPASMNPPVPVLVAPQPAKP